MTVTANPVMGTLQRRYDELTLEHMALQEQIKQRRTVSWDVNDAGDEASRVSDHDSEDTLLDEQRRSLEALAAALERVMTGDYGRCDGCGEQISAERLEARPAAVCCVTCQAQRERTRR
jgi:DnaK suppressor protein